MTEDLTSLPLLQDRCCNAAMRGLGGPSIEIDGTNLTLFCIHDFGCGLQKPLPDPADYDFARKSTSRNDNVKRILATSPDMVPRRLGSGLLFATRH